MKSSLKTDCCFVVEIKPHQKELNHPLTHVTHGLIIIFYKIIFMFIIL
jgi:hypothetical protein